MLAIDVAGVLPEVEYLEMLPLVKCLLTESTVHVVLYQAHGAPQWFVGLIST
jgi:hypothetical protein